MSLATSQMAEAMVLMTELQGAGASMEQLKGLLDESAGDDPGGDSKKTPATSAVETAETMQKEWVKLTDYFNSKAPPAECVHLRDKYDQVVRETGGMMKDIVEVVTGSQDNPAAAITKLEGMKGKSKNLIDKPALETDDGVAQICSKYKTRKWFDIQGDTGGGGLLQKMGGI